MRPILSEDEHKNDPHAIIRYKTSDFLYRMGVVIHCPHHEECESTVHYALPKTICVLHQLGSHKV